MKPVVKRIVAALLYGGFVLLAVRVDAATATPTASTYIEQAELALARFRSTAEAHFIDQAEAAVSAALALAPTDYAALRSEAALLLARHADHAALARITALNRRFPDDLDTYGVLIDAELALGLYAQAEQDTQRLLDLRPDHLPGLVRAARLRELYGDWQGAIDFVNASLTRCAEHEVAQRAELFTQLARLQFGAGQGEVAAAALDAALAAVPHYAPALEEQIRIALLEGRPAQALRTARVLYDEAPSVEHLFMLARATARAGDARQAATLFEDFVGAAQRITQHDDNANLALSAYYADEGRDAQRALALAQAARAQRGDVKTLLALAWAQHRAGHHDQALQALAPLTTLGWRDPEFMTVAAAIHRAMAATSRTDHRTTTRN